MLFKLSYRSIACLALATLAMPALAQNVQNYGDPPTRVARLSYVQGQVSFQPAGESNWVEAQINRPLVTGDNVYADRNSRLELDVGDAAIRLDERSSANLLNLTDNMAQIELTGGTLNLRVRRVYQGQTYEIDTPTLAFVVDRVGEYRIDVAPAGDSTMITVFEGAGDVYGANNASYSVRSGNSYRFHDSSLRDYEVLGIPRPDDFDNWSATRNGRYDNSESRRYVSNDVIGYQDLDTYGRWDTVSSYGSVWFPSNVSVGWAPYRDGHWAWIEPYGWTWIDRNPWGFAPFHYGRWAYVSNRWGWMPGPMNVRSIYAPALVGFIGGSRWGLGISTGPVGWFPLGRHDVYVPWYHVSRDYFRRVNVYNSTVINNVNITNIYNNYSSGRPINANYAYRNDAVAVTAVSRATFVNARPVDAGRVAVDRRQLANSHVASRLGIAPTAASIAPTAARTARTATPSRAVADRSVIARTAPPPRTTPLASRVQAIERNGGRALPVAQTRVSKPTAEVAADRRIKVVGNERTTPKPLPVRGSTPRAETPAATRDAPRSTAPSRDATRTPPADRDAIRAPADRSPARTAPATPATRERVPAERPDVQGSRTQPSQRAQPAERTQPADRSQQSERALPSSGFAPRSTRPSGERSVSPPSRTQPSSQPSRIERSDTPRSTTPSTRYAPRDTSPQRSSERSTTTPRTTQPTPPTTRQATPAPRDSAVRQAAPVQQRELIQRTAPAPPPATPTYRSAPAPKQRQEVPAAPRSAPAQQRQETPTYRSAPPPSAVPAPRTAPAPNVAPVPRPPVNQSPAVRQPQPRVQPQPRTVAPKPVPPESRSKDEDDRRRR